MSQFMAWTPYMVSAYYLCTPDDFESKDYPYITRTEKDEPQYTIEQETYMINEQIDESEGFDIDYTFFRCIFNYRPVILNGNAFVKEPETSVDLLKRLSQKALECYNEEECTKYEFVNVVKAIFYTVCGYMFFITFEVMDPYDNQAKLFQTSVHYTSHTPPKYFVCRPKPDQKVECVGTVKKQW